jgi:hypothetical protein
LQVERRQSAAELGTQSFVQTSNATYFALLSFRRALVRFCLDKSASAPCARLYGVVYMCFSANTLPDTFRLRGGIAISTWLVTDFERSTKSEAHSCFCCFTFYQQTLSKSLLFTQISPRTRNKKVLRCIFSCF